MTRPSTLTVRVPGTTSNLGPGFDTLGLALNLDNVIRITRTAGREVRISSPLADEARLGATLMVAEAAEAFFRRARVARCGFEVHLSGQVPVARGLGSSVTVRLGVTAGLNGLTRAGLDRQALLEIVAGLEHHPDNAAPALFGGFTVAGMLGDSVRCLRFRVPSQLRFITLIPPFEVRTEQARRLVPGRFTRADTVHNLNRTALITAAFASADPEALRGLFEDRIHQPYRERLIPQLTRVLQAGERAGALGGWLSGSGSTIICLAVERLERIGRAMQRQLPEAEVRILRASNRGLRVMEP